VPASRSAVLSRKPLVAAECWPLVWPEGIKGTDSKGYPRIKVSGEVRVHVQAGL
jgi:hypothetical protein